MTDEKTTSTSNTVSGEKLRSFVERIERLTEEKKAIGDDIRLVFAEAKSDGFDNKYLKSIVKLRAEKPSRANAAKKADVPDCTLDEARQMGRQARKDDEPVIANPFPWDDKRRRLWDEGWRNEDGGDGMGPA